jgi:hypothetical protein
MGGKKKMDGQTIEANFQLAEDYINKNGLGYLEIGELVCSVDEE